MTTRQAIARIVFWTVCALAAVLLMIGVVNLLLNPHLILAVIVGVGLAFAHTWAEENK